MNNKFLKIIIIIFLLFCFIVFFKGLNKPHTYIPNNNIGNKISFFSSKKLFTNEIINSNELFIENKIYLLNIWASWCVPCRKEHSILMQLSKNTSIKIIGLNYKDNLINAKKFINDMGNPYSEILRDEDGTIAIELGAYGIPETFVIDKNKIILKKFIGPLDTQSLKEIRLLIK